VSGFREMYAHLVRPTRKQSDLDQRCIRQTLANLVLGERRPSGLHPGREAGAMHWVPAVSSFEAPGRWGLSVDQC